MKYFVLCAGMDLKTIFVFCCNVVTTARCCSLQLPKNCNKIESNGAIVTKKSFLFIKTIWLSARKKFKGGGAKDKRLLFFKQ